jgi:glutamate--cysteine ligase
VRRSPVAAYVGFEPGDQLELSLPPAACPVEAAGRLAGAVARVRADLGRRDIVGHATAVDERVVPLQLATPRYLAMQAHFDTIGPAGRRMMRCTASTQVCLDWWPGADGTEQWEVLNLAGPFLAAAFAHSTGPHGRLATWLAVDPARTAFDDRLLHGDDPATTYAAFAAGATAFLDGTTAHLSTLFPPVRPRGRYLEVRFLDVQDDARPVLAALTRLAYDDDHRRRTLDALRPARTRLGELWRAAARGDAEVVARGREIAARPGNDLEAAA